MSQLFPKVKDYFLKCLTYSTDLANGEVAKKSQSWWIRSSKPEKIRKMTWSADNNHNNSMENNKGTWRFTRPLLEVEKGDYSSTVQMPSSAIASSLAEGECQKSLPLSKALRAPTSRMERHFSLKIKQDRFLVTFDSSMLDSRQHNNENSMDAWKRRGDSLAFERWQEFAIGNLVW